VVTKAAIEPVWYLPGVAKRFGCSEATCAARCSSRPAACTPSWSPAPDLEVFLPPIGGQTVYIFGDVPRPRRSRRPLTARVHDECNGSDVFGSDICTCRPYLTHGSRSASRARSGGGVGLIVYNRKEGRALGEVTKFLVYNARKRQVGGDSAAPTSPHRVRGRRAGHALPGADARRAALAGHHQDRPLRLDEQHEVRRHHRSGIEIGERVPSRTS
jgi:hypothetical protein